MPARSRTHDPIYLSLDYEDDDGPSYHERRLEEKALRQRWPITAEKRVKIVERLLTVVESPTADDFNAVSASKALISADRLNLEQQKIDMATLTPDEHGDDFKVDLEDDRPQ